MELPQLELYLLSAPTTPGFTDLLATPTQEDVARMTTDEFRQCKKLFPHLAADLSRWRTRALNNRNCQAFRKRQREQTALQREESDALRQELTDARAQIEQLRVELAMAQLEIAVLRGEI